MSLLLVVSLFNGDTHIKIKDVAYSTNPRDLMTVEQCRNYYHSHKKEVDHYGE